MQLVVYVVRYVCLGGSMEKNLTTPRALCSNHAVLGIFSQRSMYSMFHVWRVICLPWSWLCTFLCLLKTHLNCIVFESSWLFHVSVFMEFLCMILWKWIFLFWPLNFLTFSNCFLLFLNLWVCCKAYFKWKQYPRACEWKTFYSQIAYIQAFRVFEWFEFTR